MKAKSVIKKLTIYSSMITLLLTLNASNSRKRSKEFFRNTTKITRNKIDYNSGTIYIGNDYYLSRVGEHGENDVLVLDARREKDPNVKIYESYKINNREIMEEIVEALLLYEEKYPTKWDRSKNSMIREWIVHNMMYQMQYRTDSSIHVDLNNDDEDEYHISKYFRNDVDTMKGKNR